jgi:hypothetical protein
MDFVGGNLQLVGGMHRLIFVKDGFGGDLGVLDLCVDERRKDTRI